MNYRKTLFLFLSILYSSIFSVEAQNYTFNPASKVSTLNLNFNDFSYDGITFTNNNNGKLYMNWQLIQKDTLLDCEFSMCSSGTCLIGIPTTGSFAPLNFGQTGWLKLHGASGTTTGTNTLKFIVDDGNQYDTLTFIINVMNLTGLQSAKEKKAELFQIHQTDSPNQFNIKANKPIDANCNLEIYNLLGSKLIDLHVVNQETIVDLTSLANGIYLVSYRNGTGVETKKIVRNGL